MRSAIIAVALIVALPAAALDLAARALDYGVTEIGAAAAYLHVDDTENHSLELELRGGKMIGAGMELELEGTLQRHWDDDACTAAFGATGSFLYNIRTYASWVPFFLAGGGLEHDRLSFDDETETVTDAVMHFGIGTKLFFTESAALRAEYRFLNRLADPESISSHRILIGLSAFLG
jgi:opacity protein-like surface antigen